MRLVEVENLKIGDKPAKNIFDRNGRLLAGHGASLTENMISGLARFKIPAIYIEDEISKGIESDTPISDRLLSNLMDAFKTMDIDKLIECSRTMVDELSDNLFDMDMKILSAYDDYTMHHSINVAIFGTVMAKALFLPNDEVLQVTQTGLLHDIGKVMIPIEIIGKPGKLTPEEFNEIKKHSTYGYERLKNRMDIFSVVRVGVLEHHENENGSGYPKGLTGDRIHKVGKIIHIADVFDALTTKRSYKEQWSNSEAIKYILDNTGELFDRNCTYGLVKSIPMYPKGTILKLTNADKVIVTKNKIGYVERPEVRSLITGKTIELYKDRDYKNIGVEKVIHEIDL